MKKILAVIVLFFIIVVTFSFAIINGTGIKNITLSNLGLTFLGLAPTDEDGTEGEWAQQPEGGVVPITPLPILPVQPILGEEIEGGRDGNPNNFITITEKAGQTSTNYPIQIGRVFIRGEIANYPQVLLSGTPVITQSDVKTRWPDGSAKHAIMTFYIPELNPNQQIVATFQNQQTGNSQTFLTPAQMLGAQYNFGATIRLTSGSAVSASARTMLSDGEFEYWLRGSEATSIILKDHSTARRYDIGFDAHKSFRPIFLATFFPGHVPGFEKVRVRYIGEVANSQVLQDMQYSLSLTLGNSNPAAVYTKNNVYHHLATRWTKEFWIGGEPSEVAIDHNLTYLKETGFISNYDTSIVVPPHILTSYYTTTWLSVPKDHLYDPGSYVQDMGSSGGRAELGPWPQWTVYWLYTGDSRFAKMNAGMADLAAAWPVHLREGALGRFFNRANTVNALGKVLSPNARPTFRHINAAGSGAADVVQIVGSWNSNPWRSDCAHIPDPYSIQYALSGDFWYLEELWFWSSYGSLSSSYGNLGNSRGPTGKEGDINGLQTRGEARCMQIRGRTAFLSPDGTPEKSHFDLLTQEYIASKEGLFRIPGTVYTNTSMWNWGRNVLGSLRWRGGITTPPTLHFIGIGETGYEVPTVTPYTNYAVDLTWQQGLLVYTLGHLEDLGYAAGPLKNYLAEYLTGFLNHSNNTIKGLVSEYRTPTFNVVSNSYYNTYEDITNQFLPSHLATVLDNFRSSFMDANHGYSTIVMGAMSHMTNVPAGAQAWNWISGIASGVPGWGERREWNPQWAFLPRAETVPAPLLISVSPNPITYSATQNTLLSFSGSNFESGAILELCGTTGCATATGFNRVNSGLIRLNFGSGRAAGVYDFRVRNPDGQFSNRLYLTINGQGGGGLQVSQSSSVASTNLTTTAPNAPTGLVVTPLSSSSLRLNWVDNSNNENGFWIGRCTGANCNNFAGVTGATNLPSSVGTGSVREFVNTGLNPNTTYRYFVAAFNAVQPSGNSSVASGTTLPVGAFTFSITANPTSGTIQQGQEVETTITATTLTGTAQSVSFSASGLSVNEGSFTFLPTSCTPTPTCISRLTIDTTSGISVGNHSLTLTGSATPISINVPYVLTIQAVPGGGGSGGGGGGGGGGGSSGGGCSSGGSSGGSAGGSNLGTVPVSQMSISQLQELLASLRATLLALLQQRASLGGPIGTGTFTRDLEVGSEGSDVRSWQIYLNTHGFPIASSGIGSPGNESTYFGELTRVATARLQRAKGIVPALGYFGQLTRRILGL